MEGEYVDSDLVPPPPLGAPPPDRVPPPVPSRSQPPKISRSFSILSEKALISLENLNEELVRHECALEEAERVFTEHYDDRDQLLRIKNELALLNGKVDKLQMVGIDGVITAELNSGRQVAKTTRKELNRRAGQLLSAVTALHKATSVRVLEIEDGQ